MLITTVVAVAAWILLAGGIFLTQSSQFQMLGARKIEEQARQYAEVDAQVLKYVAYDKLTDETTLKGYKLHLKRAKMETVEAADWEDEIIMGDEKKSSDKSGGYRTATVNIYRKGDTKPRWSMDVILVKGAKNSSESSTGDDPSGEDDDSQFNVYVFFDFQDPYATGIAFLVYSSEYVSSRTYPYSFLWSPSNSPNPDRYLSSFSATAPSPAFDSHGRWSVNNNYEYCTINYNTYLNWYKTYHDYIIYDIERYIEALDNNIKFSSLHGGAGNATLHFTVKYTAQIDNPSAKFYIYPINVSNTFYIYFASRRIGKADKTSLSFGANTLPAEATIKSLFN